MSIACTATLCSNLKSLNLSNMARMLESSVRQARESGMDYQDFLLELTEHELNIRNQNRLKRRIKEARFPLLKTFEDYDFEAAPELDRRCIRGLYPFN